MSRLTMVSEQAMAATMYYWVVRKALIFGMGVVPWAAGFSRGRNLRLAVWRTLKMLVAIWAAGSIRPHHLEFLAGGGNPWFHERLAAVGHWSPCMIATLAASVGVFLLVAVLFDRLTDKVNAHSPGIF